MCLKIETPGGFAIVCGRGFRAKPCRFCRANGRGSVRSTKLCDFPVGKGKTCDAPMCDAYATSVGPDCDYCPAHKHHAAAVVPQAALDF